MGSGDGADEGSAPLTIEEVRGPRGPIDDEGALLTLVLSNGLEADVRVESIRTENLRDEPHSDGDAGE